VYVILVHSGDAEEAEDNVMKLKTDTESDLGVYDGKERTVQEQESGHCTSVVPVGGVENVDI
jgi:hypothetical protein